MPQDRTALGEKWFEWTAEGEVYRHGSDPWQFTEASGRIAAESAGAALEKIVTGQGEGTTLGNTLPWDVLDQDRKITITIQPAEDV